MKHALLLFIGMGVQQALQSVVSHPTDAAFLNRTHGVFLADSVAPLDDREAVIGLAHDLLRAISTRDTALARRVLAPGAQLVAATDPAPASGTVRIQSDTAFLRSIGNGTARYLERMWQPSATVHGTVALVHAPYDFHINGKFSHCGTDTFTLAKGADGWRITHLAYTVQRAGCAPSPLGAPR